MGKFYKKIRSRSYIYMLTLNAALGTFFFGYHISLVNTAGEKLKTYYGINDP